MGTFKDIITANTPPLALARTRLANARAAQIEWELSKAKRELLTIPEAFDLIRRLRDAAIEATPWQQQSVLKMSLDETVEGFKELIQQIQEDAKR